MSLSCAPSLLQEACLARDGVALKKLRASISVSVADANSPLHENSMRDAADSSFDERADACVQSRGGGARSRVFLVSKGGLGVWRRQRNGGRGRAPYAGSSVDSEKGDNGQLTYDQAVTTQAIVDVLAPNMLLLVSVCLLGCRRYL